MDRAKAIDGVNSRRILCRADYSKELQLRYDDAVFTEDQAHAKLEYYLNEENQSDRSAYHRPGLLPPWPDHRPDILAKTLASVALDLVSNVADYAQSPQMEQYVNNASSHIATMSSRLTGTASQMDSLCQSARGRQQHR